MKASVALAPAVGLAALALATGAWADAAPAVTTDLQSRLIVPHNIPVTEREHPEYDSLGLHDGPLYAQPTFATAFGFTDNEKATSVNPRSDAFFVVSPGISAHTDWAVHAVSASASVTQTTFATSSEDDSTEYVLNASGRLDISRDINIGAIISREHLVEPRSSTNEPTNTTAPNEYDQTTLDLVSFQSLNRIQLAEQFELIRQDWGFVPATGNGGYDYSYRTGDYFSLTGVAGYPISPAIGVYTSLGYSSRIYDKISNGVNRDADGVDILAGLRFDLNFSGDVAIGYKSINAAGQPLGDNPSQTGKNQGGLRLRGDLVFYPTQLTTVSVNFLRDNTDSGIALSTGRTTTRVTVKAVHELLRNVQLTGRFGVRDTTYENVLRHDSAFDLGMDVRYLINRRIALVGGYGYTHFNSTGRDAVRSFDENRAVISVVLSY